MAALTFSYRSIKDKAPLEARLSFKDENEKRRSIYSRSNIEVSEAFWNEFKEGKAFRDTEKANLKIDLDNKINSLRKFILAQFSKTDIEEISKDWLNSTIKEYHKPKPKQKDIPTDLLEYYDYYLELREHELKESIRSWQKWITVRNKLERLIESNGKSYSIAEVNDSFVKDWTIYCKAENYSKHTIKKEFAYIKMICMSAKRKGIEVSPELDTLSVNIKAEDTLKYI